MSRALRLFTALIATLAVVLVGSAGRLSGAPRATAASKQVLNVVVVYPYLDPKLYLNAQTKKTSPAFYTVAEMTQKVFNLFYKMHPDYVINPISTWGWGDPLRQKFLLTVAAGSAPDVMIGEDFIPELARDGVLEPIPLGAQQKDVVPGPLSPGIYQGKVYAVPAHTGIFALAYNKGLMRQAGLDPNKPPRTWDQWLADSRKIAALGHGISGTLVEGNTGLGATFRLIPFLRQLGGDLMDKTGTKITFNSPANARALAFLRQLAGTEATGLTSVTDEGKVYAQWYNGKAGFALDGPWSIGSPLYAKMDIGFTDLPLPAGGHPANVIVANLLECVPRLAKHKQAALDFVRLLTTAQASRLNYSYTGYMPSNMTVLRSVIQAGGPRAVFAKELLNPNITALPTYPANPQKIWDVWYNVQVAALATTQSIPGVLAKAQSDAEALLQQ